MTKEEHLHIADITAFREGLLSDTEHTTAAHHLVRCRNCRDLLPLPRKNEFLDCLFGEDLQSQKTSTWVSIKSLLAGPIFNRPAIRNAVFAGLFLFAVLGFSFLMWTQPGSPVDESLVAVVTDSRDSNDLQDVTGPTKPNNLVIPGRDTTDSRSVRPDRDADTASATLSDRKDVRNEGGRRSPKPTSTQRAETRGSSLPCGGPRLVDLEVRKAEDGLRLTWNKVPNAASYTVYLSDLDERLVDQFETADETSYLVSVPLDSETVYRWKLIATLKNGERIGSEDLDFRLGASGPIPVRKRTTAAVRCMENKQ